MGLDIRLPIGMMFSLLGALLSAFGLVTSGDDDMYKRSLQWNVNLWWGLFLLAFGVVMLAFALRQRFSKVPSGPMP